MDTMGFLGKSMHGTVEGIVERRETTPGYWDKNDVWVEPRFQVVIRLQGGTQVTLNLRHQEQFEKYHVGQTVKVGFMLIGR